MATNRVTYSSLKIKNNQNVETFQFGNSAIEVIKYLSIKDKNDLVIITMQKSLENEIYNPIKLDMYFHLHIVYLMTNITFTEKQKEDEFKLYDTLQSSGLMDEILKHIEPAEYNKLYDYLQETLEKTITYKNSFAGVVSKVINDLPKNASAAMDIVNNFDKEQFSEVIKFAEAANGGRPIAELLK